MSRITGVAAIQMKCGRDVLENIKTADRLVRDAVKKGADIILLPELLRGSTFVRKEDMNTMNMQKVWTRMQL